MTDQLPQRIRTTPLPANETERLAALHRYKILDTPPEAAFDRITTLAARLFDFPIVLISLVDESRAWFKSSIGFDASEVRRDATLCSFALLTNESLIVPDTRQDDRFACNPFVQSEPGVRFYAGAPLLTPDGFNLGTLCLLDTQPHEPLSPKQQATLVDLAAMVVDELELRLAAHQIAQVNAALLEMTQGVSTVTGDAFFSALVQHLVKVLDTDYAYIGLVRGAEPKMLRTIATCAHAQLVDNLEYPLQDTPCWEVIAQRKTCCYPRNVQAQFPNAPLLKPLAVESYVAVPCFDSSGTPLGLLGVMDAQPLEQPQLAESLLTIFADRVVTELERQQIEADLREAHVQLEAALRAGAIYTWRWKIPENLVIVNQAFAHLFGADPVQAADGLPLEQFVQAMHEEDRPRVVAAIHQAIETGQEYVAEYRVHTATGEQRWLVARGRVEYGADGTPLAFPGALADITDRKQAEAAWRESENRLRLALESAELGIWDFNPITGVLQWDDQCKAAFGLSPESEINYDVFLSGLHPEDRERTDQIVQFALNPESNGEYDIEYRTIGLEDGVARWIAAKGRAFFNPAGIACRFIGTVLNISEKKRAEAEREHLLRREQAARVAAEQANRIKDEFLAVLSHELRSPLNPILGWTRLLQNGKLDATRQAEAIATIERNAKLQSQLIEDLLDIARIMQGKLALTATPTSLLFVISAALETVQLAAEAKSIAIVLDLTSDIAPIFGDAARLQQVVWNLLTNAVKFTPSGGQVTVELRQIGQSAQIQVIDTGKGINPDFLPHVFEYFRQEDGSTTRRFGGLGLGLAIVRQIVELHGGMVRAESAGENQGATFIVQLPVMPQTASISPRPSRTQTETEAPLDNIQVLLVDDDTDTREFQAFLLEQNGAKVTAVSSGLAALEVLEQSIPDVIVSDVGMPHMDGYMLMQQLRALPLERGGQTPAIALTAYAGELNYQQVLQAGFQQHLTKPVEPDKLIKAITTLIGRK
ncbi:PAS domain-containing protein [Trichocoleus sp. FACHB-591]|uniref:hybrid sensor histidine kinase/response regulator n=1 Tax=Trichocoleus sp. FACHB-591 TaxID=2692872 RepID=UPI001687AC54|nr:ATP-binding protein [Trichocoleus sp. FACHB-591]MBD2096360.1 PAS domain-containing protein [Trichocoleus sp. FACHB-591]